MANTIRVPRAHLIMALCLPLAVVLGYLLAQPTDLGSLAAVGLVLGLLTLPLLMKWHHLLLIASWNAVVVLAFLPGRPGLWMVATVVSLLVAVLNRAVNAENTFLNIRSLTLPLACFAAVVIATIEVNGGIGLQILGSGQYGGRSYFFILLAVAGYFALTSQRIPAERAGLYVGLFFLSGLTAMAGDLIYAAGPGTYFLQAVFPVGVDTSGGVASASYFNAAPTRLGGVGMASLAVSAYLLARYGLRGVFDTSRPWRLLLLLAGGFGSATSGYRSMFVLFALTLVAVFWFEGIWRSRAMPIALCAVVVIGGLMLSQAHLLPYNTQRALSVLPLPAKADARAIEDARGTTEWRTEMWKLALPEIPRYLVKGKGYALNPNDLFLTEVASRRGYAPQWETSLLVGGYHNGPLSVIIPFGIFGAITFVWFLAATVLALYYNYRFSPPELLRINTFLFASFVVKAVFFFTVFGALYSDLFVFTGLAGFSISLNGGICEPATEETSEPLEGLAEGLKG